MANLPESDRKKPVVVLFRHDLRVADNRALSSAAETGKPVIPLFVLDEESNATRPIGGARRWWLHHSLTRLSERLERLGCDLVLHKGPQNKSVAALVEESRADVVLWNRRYDPPGNATDVELASELTGRGVISDCFDGHLLHEPSAVMTTTGHPYRVFTPFWRAVTAIDGPRDPVDPPKSLRRFERSLKTDRLEDWRLLPETPDWAGGLREAWMPGEEGAQANLEDFLAQSVKGYAERRDFPFLPGTSRLSPHLVHGEITPFQIVASLRAFKNAASTVDVDTFRKELGWREFCWHLLVHNPQLSTQNFNRQFDRFRWSGKADLLKLWQQGRTGYPIVDAGMRQLWQTGWMHNRVRMITASFLVKHLLVDWREGERWFWDTLVDADPANNPANWQWVTGSGADAAPYFRVFNPILQGEKFDPGGQYVRQFLPEIRSIPDNFVHKPWQATADILLSAKTGGGKKYPLPIVEHSKARVRALEAYKQLSGK